MYQKLMTYLPNISNVKQNMTTPLLNKLKNLKKQFLKVIKNCQLMEMNPIAVKNLWKRLKNLKILKLSEKRIILPKILKKWRLKVAIVWPLRKKVKKRKERNLVRSPDLKVLKRNKMTKIKKKEKPINQ